MPPFVLRPSRRVQSPIMNNRDFRPRRFFSDCLIGNRTGAFWSPFAEGASRIGAQSSVLIAYFRGETRAACAKKMPIRYSPSALAVRGRGRCAPRWFAGAPGPKRAPRRDGCVCLSDVRCRTRKCCRRVLIASVGRFPFRGGAGGRLEADSLSDFPRSCWQWPSGPSYFLCTWGFFFLGDFSRFAYVIAPVRRFYQPRVRGVIR